MPRRHRSVDPVIEIVSTGFDASQPAVDVIAHDSDIEADRDEAKTVKIALGGIAVVTLGYVARQYVRKRREG